MMLKRQRRTSEPGSVPQRCEAVIRAATVRERPARDREGPIGERRPLPYGGGSDRVPGSFLVIAVVLGATLAGCSQSGGRKWYAFERRKSSDEYLSVARESESPDERRRGVIGLADGPDRTSDWAVKVFDTIARTDTDAMVRCAALRALRPTADDDVVPLLLRLLRTQDERFDDMRPAPAPVRWAAARLLFIVVHDQAFAESRESDIVKTLLERLGRERDHNVRLTIIDTLGFIAAEPVVGALIDVLADEDFAIKHAAELALASLTGVTHGHAPDAWREWLAQTQDPFANAGEMPDALQAKGDKPRWDWLEWW